MMSTLLRSNRTYLRPSKTSQTLKLFLRLPPSYRSFHATPRSQFLESTLIGTHAILEGLHSVTGLPWAYTIPLAALAIRTALFLPLGIYARRATQKQMELRPLLLAWQHVYIKEAVKEVGNKGQMAMSRYTAAKLRKKQQDIYARFNCGSWK